MRRYSRASDVWAYGVFVWEVMTRGEEPYSEFATLPEIVGQVKEGYRLACPKECTDSVYHELLQPCWEADPRARPHFSTLLKTLQSFGIEPADHVDAARISSTSVTSFSPSNASSRISARPEPDEWLLRGLSVHHLSDVFAPRIYTDVGDPLAQIWQAVEVVVKPHTASVICPRDNELGSAYVDTLPDGIHAGRATALLSCEHPSPPPHSSLPCVGELIDFI